MATIHEPTEPRSRLSAGTLVLVVFGLICLVVLLIAVAVYAMWRRQVQVDIQAELTRIRQAGEPTTVEELAAFYTPSPEATATAAAWLAATQPLREPAFEAMAKAIAVEDETPVSDILSADKPWPVQAKAEQAVRQYARSLEQLYAAADRGGVARYPVDLRQGFLTNPSISQDLRSGCRLLQWDAYLRARQKDAAGVARATHAVLMLAHSLEAEPAVVSYLARVAFGGMGNRFLLEALPVVQFSPQDLRRLQDAVRTQDFEGGLYRAMVGERVYGLRVMNDPAMLKDIPSYEELAARVKRSNRDLDRRCYLNLMGQLVAAAQQPWPDAIRAAHRVNVESCAITAQNASFLAKDRYLITDTILPAMQTLFASTTREIAMRRVADAAIALELYRREHGRLPGDLSQLEPKYLPCMPQDPFNGQPLRYVVEEDGYLLYSVGANRVDDGGVLEGKGQAAAFSPDVGVRMSKERPIVTK